MEKRPSRFNLESADEIAPAGIETPSSAAHGKRLKKISDNTQKSKIKGKRKQK